VATVDIDDEVKEMKEKNNVKEKKIIIK